MNNYDVPFEGYKAEEYYPGDVYVNWVGIDGYNTGESVPNATWDHLENFTQRFKHMLDRFENHSNITKKPYGIFEIGSSSVVDANTVDGSFNVFTNKNSPTNHYLPSGWMGDWQDITYEEVTNDSYQEISCGNSSIKVTYFTDPNVENHYISSGWTGGYIEFDDSHATNVYSGSTCIKINYSIGQLWAGIYWQDPENNWGDKEGGFNLAGATKLIFWAKGAQGCEHASFMMGGVSGNNSSDTANASIEVNLTNIWKKHVIDLTGTDLSNIITGFGWVAGKSDNLDGCTIYLDEVRYENISVEIGVSNNSKKGAWLAETYKTIKKYPKIKTCLAKMCHLHLHGVKQHS